MKICFVLGTRPEIIKLSPLIKLCKKKKIKYFIIHTGQHYTYLMDGKFLDVCLLHTSSPSSIQDGVVCIVTSNLPVIPSSETR